MTAECRRISPDHVGPSCTCTGAACALRIGENESFPTGNAICRENGGGGNRTRVPVPTESASEQGEYVGMVGSREGADLEHVELFTRELYEKYPDTILVSGGADGVDKTAERTWLSLGGQLVSFRPKQLGVERFAIEVWELGGPNPRVYVPVDHPTFADYGSACLYRDMLIAEKVKRLVSFFRPGRSRGAGFTAEHARNCERLVYEFEAAA